MKTLIIILIILSFIQSTILPLNLVLIILICRAFIKIDKSNLYLAFGFGLFISYLNLWQLGVESFVYLIIIQVVHSITKSKFASNSLLIVPISLFFLAFDQTLISLFSKESLVIYPKVFIETVISLPTLYMIRIWEERFIIHKQIKLKVVT